MKISDVKEILGAEVHCGEDLFDFEVKSAFGSDMMSDVLAFVDDQTVLLTGLLNPQVVRTAAMLDLKCSVFVRGKKPTEEIVALAKECGISVLSTECRLFVSCGRLYENGLCGIGGAR